MPESIDVFFDRYRGAFDAFDADSIASFLHCPCFMVDRHSVVPWNTREAILRNCRGLLAYHREHGYARASVSDLETLARSEGLAIVRLRWRVFRADDSLLWEWVNTYNLIESDGGFRIVASTTHESPAA